MKKCFMFHKWRLVKRMCNTKYYECEICKKRRVSAHTNHAVNRSWLDGESNSLESFPKGCSRKI